MITRFHTRSIVTTETSDDADLIETCYVRLEEMKILSTCCVYHSLCHNYQRLSLLHDVTITRNTYTGEDTEYPTA